MRNENRIIILNKKCFFIDHIKYCFPCEVSKYVDMWGVLEKYKGNRYNLNEINDIISDIIKYQPYIEGSMDLEIAISWENENVSGYHMIINIKNYYYELEQKGDLIILFRE